ncbi:MAG: glycosyltransferase family 4 protein, partial [Verrucomicrobiota bacterium]|nr:glycosyltransferase family 4 protein [Verrucomicrobiota bacterium]
GGHRLIYQRMRQLVDHGHQVGLVAFSDQKEEKQVCGLREQLLEVETVPAKERRLVVRMFRDYISASLPAIFWKNYSREMMRLVGDMVERTKYNVVIAEFAEMGMYLYRNPYLSAVHKVVSCHRCLTSSFAKYMETSGVPWALRLKSASQMHVLEKYEFELYSAMDHILTLTTEDRFTLLNHAPQLPVSVIPPGIDLNHLDREPAAKPDYPIIMMCGYFADKSNHDGAMWFIHEVWPEVAKRHPNLRCFLIGEGASHEMELLAKKDDHIVVTGSVNDLRPYREQATIFINPMRLGSGLRIKVLEAMATGLPVVTTTLGAAGIPAQNGVNCFVADTPELFVDSIEWLLNDGQLAKKMGCSAKEMVKKQYDIRSTIRELEQVLTEVVSM